MMTGPPERGVAACPNCCGWCLCSRVARPTRTAPWAGLYMRTSDSCDVLCENPLHLTMRARLLRSWVLWLGCAQDTNLQWSLVLDLF